MGKCKACELYNDKNTSLQQLKRVVKRSNRRTTDTEYLAKIEEFRDTKLLSDLVVAKDALTSALNCISNTDVTDKDELENQLQNLNTLYLNYSVCDSKLLVANNIIKYLR